MPGPIADDAKVRELRAVIDAHHSHGGDALALQALEALAAIRDDRSLLHIHHVASRMSGKLKKRATQILGDVCRQRGLSQDELEDRIVPELGLDEHGTMTLDFGARTFTVGFDELLRPFVRDASGTRLAALPHAAKSDDEEKASRAAEAWKLLKDDVKTIGAEQARRLERAMVAERQWSSEAFAERLVAHRLLGHLATRLVYGVVRDGAIQQTFRVAEDRSYADVDDRPLTLAPDARVVIVHPVKLDDATRMRWRQTFADYHTMQPFLQLERETITLTPEDLKGTTTNRFAGKRAHGGTFFGLRGRGWELAYNVVIKRIDKGVRVELGISPGIDSYGRQIEDQTLGALASYGKTFSALAPIARAEILRDVEMLHAKTLDQEA